MEEHVTREEALAMMDDDADIRREWEVDAFLREVFRNSKVVRVASKRSHMNLDKRPTNDGDSSMCTT